jgi:hypothetical protein
LAFHGRGGQGKVMAMVENSTERFDLIIEPKQSIRHFWRELWKYRELFYFLSWRDVLVQYKQTLVGVLWSVLRPLLTMLVFTFIFGRLARLPAEGIPYPALVFCGMLPWHFFAVALSESSNSLVGNANLISKIYFPRLIFYYFMRTPWMVWLVARLALAGTALLSIAGLRRCPGRRAVVRRLERKIPRLPLRHSFCSTVWPLYLSCRIFQYDYTFEVAAGLCPQPHGRGDRRFSLGNVRRAYGHESSDDPYFHRGFLYSAQQRNHSFP